MRTSLLRAERLGKRFGAVEAVKDATFEVHPQTIAALLGENGAGKTTLLRLVLGFLNPDSGRFSFASERIGYIPERPAFFPWLRGDEILLSTARAFGFSRLEANREIESICRRIVFDPRLLTRKVQTFSLGNQKKFSYLQSLLVNPDLLIVDEPFSALDPVSIKNIRLLFLELRAQGKALLLSSHLISEMERICDEFMIIKGGRVVIQENLPRFRDSHVFIRFAKSQLGEWASIPMPNLQKTTDRFVEWLFPLSRLGEIDRSLLDTAHIGPPDLETVYLFLAD